MGRYGNCFMLTKYHFYQEMSRCNLPKSPKIWLKSPFLRYWEVVEDGQRSHIVRCEFIYTKCSSLTYIQHPDFPKTDDLTTRGRQCSVFLIFHRLAQKVVFSVRFGQQLFRSDHFFWHISLQNSVYQTPPGVDIGRSTDIITLQNTIFGSKIVQKSCF